ncbi:MAG: hypothetical protein P0S96_03980 [Simkaniaceae bacterium]|nr:hypothetical protein [Candidatus Sacchlamyda saccharinae]
MAAAAASAASSSTPVDLSAIDKVFSQTSGLGRVSGKLDVQCELLLSGGYTGEKLPFGTGSAPLHVFMRITSEKDSKPYRVVIRGDDQTGEISCSDDSDHFWTDSHIFSVIDLGKMNVHKSKGGEIKGGSFHHTIFKCRSPLLPSLQGSYGHFRDTRLSTRADDRHLQFVSQNGT